MALHRRLPPLATPLGLIVLAVFIANGLYLTGLSDANPISWTSGIAHAVCRGSCGRPAIDPNVGFITQPLGHLAAADLLHFHLPWWNYFEGLGQPLAGEMQSAALFPLTLLFALPSGLLWFHICLEVIAGASTYFLAKRLGASELIATTGGILFALNGTYAWLGNSVLNPVAFLPMLLLGIELIYDSTRGSTSKGWYLAAIAIALSLYAGFPEVAYFDGLFCVGWAAVRYFDLAREHRLLAAKRIGLAGGVGLLLSLPILVPFYDFMKVAFVGSHTADVAGVAKLTLRTVPMFTNPYIYGTIFRNPNAVGPWGSIGGYFLASVTVMALLGLFGKRHRPLRIFLGAWTIIAIFGMTDFLRVRYVWNLIPLVKTATLARYIMPTCEMAVIVLAVLGLVDFATTARAKRLINLSSLLTVLLLLMGVWIAGLINQGIVMGSSTRIIHAFLNVLPFIAVAVMFGIAQSRKIRFGLWLLAAVLVAESLIMFAIPEADAPDSTTVDRAPISFLQTNQGEARYLDFGILIANLGSQFNLNSLSAIDLPWPKSFNNFIQWQLFPGMSPQNQFVIRNGLAGEKVQQHQLLVHFAAYEGASVKYLVFPNGLKLLPGLARLGLKQVFTDKTATIYETPSPRPFYSTASASCTVTSTTVDEATVHCPSGATTLLRTELSMAGWRASVNGSSVPIATVDGVYQSITVPKGTSNVSFTFLPPHEKFAVLLGLFGALFLVGSWSEARFGLSRRARHAAPR